MISTTNSIASCGARWRGPVLAAILTAFVAGCSTTPGGVPVDRTYTSRGQDSRAEFLVIHYTVGNFASSLKVLTEGRVSAHYLVSDESPPKIYNLVDENRRAWHAGASAWRGSRNLNASSIGIEIVHPGFRLNAQGVREYLPFPKAQIDTLMPLVKDIVARHQIRPERIVGHGEIAPRRKEDPGPTFPWKRLADEGLIPWPDADRLIAPLAAFEHALPDVAWFQAALVKYGFELAQTGTMDEATRDALIAFQMRYRQARYDGVPDAQTGALLHVLTTPPEAVIPAAPAGAPAAAPAPGPAASAVQTPAAPAPSGKPPGMLQESPF
jgi:N-acetylmuramoyl-L-alanine amidase